MASGNMSSSNRDAFEARLARIRAAQAGGPPADRPGAAPGSRSALRPVLAVLTLLSLAGIGFLGWQNRVVPDAVTAGSAAPAPAPVLAAAASDSGPLAMLAGLLGLAPRADAPPPVLADLLPAAPDGWLRLTASEARDPSAPDRLRAAWDALPPEGRLPLDSHPGLAALQAFLAGQSGTLAPGASNRERALYLGPDGGVLTLSAILRPVHDAFGPPGDDVAWRQALRREVKAESTGGEIVESVTLGDVQAFNRTRPAGKSHSARPIAQAKGEATAMKLSAAITQRLEVRIVGTATADAAGALLAGLNRPMARALGCAAAAPASDTGGQPAPDGC